MEVLLSPGMPRFIARLTASLVPLPGLPQGSDADKAEAGRVLVTVLEALRIVAVLLSPVTPRFSASLYAALGLPEQAYASLRWSNTAWGVLEAGNGVPKPKPLFARIEDQAFVTEAAPSKQLASAATYRVITK